MIAQSDVKSDDDSDHYDDLQKTYSPQKRPPCLFILGLIMRTAALYSRLIQSYNRRETSHQDVYFTQSMPPVGD